MVLLATACANSTAKNQQTEEKQPIPEGAVEMKYNRHAYFNVMLRDSIPARMIFDTGSNNLLIDSTFYASTFGEGKNLHRAMLGGAGNGHELTTLDASGWSYSVGEESHTEQMAIIMNLRKILGDGADGLFGLPFMRGKRVEFNYAGGYMRFLVAEEKIGDDFTAIQCKRLDNIERIIIPLSVTFSIIDTCVMVFMIDRIEDSLCVVVFVFKLRCTLITLYTNLVYTRLEAINYLIAIKELLVPMFCHTVVHWHISTTFFLQPTCSAVVIICVLNYLEEVGIVRVFVSTLLAESVNVFVWGNHC
jgi:hypothetical protein